MASENPIATPLAALGADILSGMQSVLGSPQALDWNLIKELPCADSPEAGMDTAWFWEADHWLHHLPPLEEQEPWKEKTEARHTMTPFPSPESSSSIVAEEPDQDKNLVAPIHKGELKAPDTDEPLARPTSLKKKTHERGNSQRVGGFADFAQKASATPIQSEELPQTMPTLEHDPAFPLAEQHCDEQLGTSQTQEETTSARHQPTALKNSLGEENKRMELPYPVQVSSSKKSLAAWAQKAQAELDTADKAQTGATPKRALPTAPRQAPDPGSLAHETVAEASHSVAEEEATETDKPKGGMATEAPSYLPGISAKAENQPEEETARQAETRRQEARHSFLSAPRTYSKPQPKRRSVSVVNPDSSPLASDQNSEMDGSYVEATNETRTQAPIAEVGKASQEMKELVETHPGNPQETEPRHTMHAEPTIPSFQVKKRMPALRSTQRSSLKAWQALRLNYRRRTGM